MNYHGCSRDKIAAFADISVTTVKKVIDNVRNPPDITADDHSHVDRAFMARYPPKRTPFELRKRTRASEHKDDAESESVRGLDDSVDCRAGKRQKRLPWTHGELEPEVVVEKIDLRRPENTAHPEKSLRARTAIAPAKPKKAVQAPHNTSASAPVNAAAGRSGGSSLTGGRPACPHATGLPPAESRPIPPVAASSVPHTATTRAAIPMIDLNNPASFSSTATSQRARTPPSIPETPAADAQPALVTAFLANLDIDLSRFYDDITADKIRSVQDFVSIREWPEDELRKILREAVPKLSVLERWVLARGIREIDADGKITPSEVKKALDAVSNARNAYIRGLFVAPSLGLSPDFLPLLRAAGLDTFQAFVIVTSRTKDQMQHLLEEALPSLKPIPRFILAHALHRVRQDLKSKKRRMQELVNDLESVDNYAAADDENNVGTGAEANYSDFAQTFLAALDHDLSPWAALLSGAGLASARVVATLRGWTAEDLHAMFKELCPDLPVVKRWVLVRGIRTSDPNGVVNKSGMRAAVDAVLDAWTLPATRLLTTFAHDLSEFLPAFTAAHLGTHGALGVLMSLKTRQLKGWESDELHAMFKEVLPGLGVIKRYVLVKGLTGM